MHHTHTQKNLMFNSITTWTVASKCLTRTTRPQSLHRAIMNKPWHLSYPLVYSMQIVDKWHYTALTHETEWTRSTTRLCQCLSIHKDAHMHNHTVHRYACLTCTDQLRTTLQKPEQVTDQILKQKCFWMWMFVYKQRYLKLKICCPEKTSPGHGVGVQSPVLWLFSRPTIICIHPFEYLLTLWVLHFPRWGLWQMAQTTSLFHAHREVQWV